MSPSNLGMHNHTLREIVADGAQIGTFKSPAMVAIHAYIELDGGIPHMACGVHGLDEWRKREPETMDCHGGPASVTCGRCTRILGDALEVS